MAAASGRIGYVCFEGQTLLDWALTQKGSKSTELAAEYVSKWIAMLEPDTVITENPVDKCQKGENTKALIGAMQKEVLESNLEFRQVVHPRRYENKYEEAACYALAFPEIKQKMPKKPQVWKSEPVDTVYVEAIAFALEVIDPERKLIA